MTEKERLLKVRKALKDKKPEFKQQNFGKKVRVSDRWRKPKGHQSKMRHQFKGYNAIVKKGWKSPAAVRGLHISGLNPILVHNVQELSTLKKEDGVMISATVGNKKRLEIINKAESLGLKVLNIKVDKFKAKIAKEKEAKSEEKKTKEEHKKKSIEDSLKKAEKKEKDKAKVADANKETAQEVESKSAEDKKAEKKHKDDVLIHKE